MKTATAFVASVLLAGCTALGDPTEGLDVSAAGTASQKPGVAADGATTIGGTLDGRIPQVTAAGTSPISPNKQVAFCKDQVAFMYSTEPQYASAGERVVAADGSTTIAVTVDKGNEPVKTFKCRLDASSRFIDVTATPSERAL